MKKIIYASILAIILVFTGCFISSKEVITDEGLLSELDQDWDYTEPRTSYKPTYDSEYWNLLKDKYTKMYYEAALETDFSDSIQKNIYLFYGNEVNEFSYINTLKGIQFARFDHPEQELMDFEYRTGSSSNAKGNVYKDVTYVCRNFEEYSELLDEVNSEIQNLVEIVNNTDDIIEKHKLIFKWITSNVTYLQADSDVGTVDFNDGEYLLARLETNTTQNIYGAIVNKEAVCDGIADAYKYICNCCNLECVIVDGYIGDLSENKYHAWNLVKVNDEWYMVDATWNLGDDSSSYFMVKDLNKGDRTPFDIGFDLPGYSKNGTDETNDVSFEDSSKKNELVSNEGITFCQEDENYEVYASDSNLYTCCSSSGFERILNKEKIEKEICIKTNAKVTDIRYYDYNDTLIAMNNSLKKSEIIFPDTIDDIYVKHMEVTLKYKHNKYKISVTKTGA